MVSAVRLVDLGHYEGGDPWRCLQCYHHATGEKGEPAEVMPPSRPGESEEGAMVSSATSRI